MWGAYIELFHVFEHDAVVCCVEGVLEVRVKDVHVFFVEFRVFHCHDDGGHGVVDATVLSKAVLLVAENAVGFGVFRAYVFF
jgi:hypothetical protein